MIVRLFATLALALTAASAFAADGQTATPGCNCPKCQAIRQAAQIDQTTYSAMPSGLYAAPSQPAEVRPVNNEQPANNVQPAFHHYQQYGGPLPATNCPPGGGMAPGWGTAGPAPGSPPFGWNYPYGHPGRMFTGGNYGPHGGAHGTPGYPRHMHMNREYVGPQGPPTAQVAYPYYTVRGPRDFLIDNPPSIGR